MFRISFFKKDKGNIYTKTIMLAGKLILLSGKFLQENNVREGDTNSSVIWWKYPKKSYSLLQ